MDTTVILQRILEADRKGREACEEALRDREEFLRDREELHRRTEEQAVAQAERDVKDARERALEAARASLETLDEKQEYRLKELRVRCEAGMETWAESLFRMVVGLDD